jgi:hypothetical protein
MAYIGITDYHLDRAIAQIYADYGDVVSIVDKNKTLTKYGRNDNLGTTEETIWINGGNENYPTGNDIDTITTTLGGGNNQELVIEGHTKSGSDLTFVSQTATLNGNTNVVLTTPLYRANRMFNNGATDLAGTVLVVDLGTSTHLSVTGDVNQSLKCATSTSSEDYWIITGWSFGVNRQQTRSVDFKLKIREFGKTFRARALGSSNSAVGSNYIPFVEPLIMIPNSDMKVTGISSGTGTGVEATVFGYLAKII